MVDRLDITKNWLPRYTGMPLSMILATIFY